MYANYSGMIQDQVEKLTADIQSRVATFLSLKSTLVTLKSSPNPDVANKAAALYTRQEQLESLLTINLDKVKKLQVSGLSFSAMPDIVSIGNFASAMESQISDVNTLADASRGVPVKRPSLLSAGLNMKTGMMLLGGLVAGFIVYKAVK